MSLEPRRGSLLVIFLTVLIDLLGFGIVLPLLPIYAAQFEPHPTGIQLGALMASFSAMQFLFAPLWGRISDRIGRRPVIMVGLFASLICYLLFGWATVRKSLVLLFVSRIGAGMAGATISTAQAYIADTTSVEGRAKGMALVGMAFGIGFTFGPLLGYLAVPDGQGDPGPMPGVMAAVLSGVAFVLAWFLLPESLNPESDQRPRRLFDLQAIKSATALPSIGSLVLAVFVSVFAFSMFEPTLGLLVKGETDPPVFEFSFRQVCLTFAYVGFVLAIVQGGVVRRVAGRVAEGHLAAGGAAAEVLGFAGLAVAADQGSIAWLFASLTVLVSGFAFITPSLNGLISRRTDPRNQGSILGLAQSASALARILGPAIGIPMLMAMPKLPLFVGAATMAVGCTLIVIAASKGHDFEDASEGEASSISP